MFCYILLFSYGLNSLFYSPRANVIFVIVVQVRGSVRAYLLWFIADRFMLMSAVDDIGEMGIVYAVECCNNRDVPL